MVDTEYFRSKLEARRKELEGMIAEIEDRLDDPRPAGFAEQAVEREDDEVLELREKVEFEEMQSIDAALARIRNGVFGVCLSCGELISKERLEAVPYASLCRNCMHD